MNRYEFHAFATVSANSEQEAREAIGETFHAVNKGEGTRVYLEDGPPIDVSEEE